jgi:hypothetical protein
MSPPLEPLGRLATLGWALLVLAIGQVAGTLAVVSWNLAHGLPALAMTGYDGKMVALLTLVTNPVQVALFAWVARGRAGADPAAYLGLTRFSLRDLLLGVLLLAALAAVIESIKRLAGFDPVTTFETEIYATSRAEGWLPPLILAIVVVGPIGEEIMFRGFLFRGWVTADWRGAFAVVVITLLWSAMHIQYDWFGITQVFVTGLLLGWIRWRTASTALTIVLHMLVNLESTIETMVRSAGP